MSTPTHDDVPRKIRATVDALGDRLAAVARDIHAHPELCYEERYAADRLAGELERAGLTVERGAGGVATALRARIAAAPQQTASQTGSQPGSQPAPSPGPRVAVLAEYDALPEVGHACGHNLIATAALGAALALHQLRDSLPGEVIFLGTPAEEGGGGKIRLLEAGLFDGIDAALMFHPSDRSLLWQPHLAMTRVEVVFHGSPSHAAMAPWDGVSALRAVIHLFNLLDSARVHMRDGARVHGIITDGGSAVNIIPERAAGAFSLRATNAEYLDAELVPMFRRCVEAAALATGATFDLIFGQGYKDVRNNLPLARRFGEHLGVLGVPFVENDPGFSPGSTDMGDVSHAVPAIHPYLAICDLGETTCHQRKFAHYAASDRGLAVARTAACALAMTAWDILADDGLRAAVHDAFQQNRKVL